MVKIFNESREYFDFINKYKEKYNILKVKCLKKSIKVEYEKRKKTT